MYISKVSDKENLNNNQELLKLVIISFILVTLMCDSGMILLGEIICYLTFVDKFSFYQQGDVGHRVSKNDKWLSSLSSKCCSDNYIVIFLSQNIIYSFLSFAIGT